MISFFSDLFRAEAELANARRIYPELELELLPVGLGDAFQRTQAGKAMIVPSQNEVANAGLERITIATEEAGGSAYGLAAA